MIERPPVLLTNAEIAELWGVSEDYVNEEDVRARLRFMQGVQEALLPHWRDLTDGTGQKAPTLVGMRGRAYEEDYVESSNPFCGHRGAPLPDVTTMSSHARSAIGSRP